MIVLYTDFGSRGYYVGQVKTVLHGAAPGVPIVDLMNDAPAHDPMRAAYLLAALVDEFPADTVFVAVVDPGVGGDRTPGVLAAGGRWYVSPDNGLLEMVIRRADATPGGGSAQWWEILWRPERLSATFHGRDLFAPIAARIAGGERPTDGADFKQAPIAGIRRRDWPDDLAEVIYVDEFGNAITGLRAAAIADDCDIAVAGLTVPKARKFADAPAGGAFWYENSAGLAEIAVNRGRSDEALKIGPGSGVSVIKM